MEKYFYIVKRKETQKSSLRCKFCHKIQGWNWSLNFNRILEIKIFLESIAKGLKSS